MNAQLDELLEANGRHPRELRRTVMPAVEVVRSDAELRRKLADRAWAVWRAPGMIVGTPAQRVDQLGAFEAAGAQRIMLQWLDLDDLDGLELLARAVLP
jgi:alkanesulfonate monooxygenase SsuD/methylene tetrahydromethanopterin reductase-like flavin-dependent oxidoreductase (luciferase family)